MFAAIKAVCFADFSFMVEKSSEIKNKSI